MIKKSEQILEHPFYQEFASELPRLLQLVHDYVQNGLESGELEIANTPRQRPYQVSVFSNYDQYVYSEVEFVHRLQRAFERLEHIRAYLAHFRILKQHKEAGVNLAQYVEYHYSNHASTLVGIYDLALILTNNTFRLGFPLKQCRQENIIHNDWVCKAGVDKALKKLNSTVEPLREPRNLSIHRGIPRSSLNINDLSMSERLNLGRPYRTEVERIIKKLNKEEESVFGAIMELFSGLQQTYKFWKTVLSDEGKSKEQSFL